MELRRIAAQLRLHVVQLEALDHAGHLRGNLVMVADALDSRADAVPYRLAKGHGEARSATVGAEGSYVEYDDGTRVDRP